MSTLMMLLNMYLPSVRNEEGQGLAEYALIIVLVSIAAVVALTSLGGTVSGVFESIVGELGAAE